MGIIKKIFILFLLLSVFILTGKTANDTVFFDGDIYVKHIVKGGESLNSIAKLHKVKTADIISNNEIQKRLYYNQLLYIPIFYNQLDDKNVLSVLSNLKKMESSALLKDTSVINIALLMPYFLLKNDTMFNDFEDITEIPNIYYKGSEIALSFHLGVKLALDSLRRLGKNIRLHTFDTNKDTLKVHQIVSSNILENMHIIIGPLYANNFRILCERYGNDITKILISPLSKNILNVKKNKSVYQISPSFSIQTNIIMKYVLKNHKDDRVIVLNQKGFEGKSTYIKNMFTQNGKEVEIFSVIYTKVDSIRKMFNAKQVVIIPSDNKAFVSKILGSIGGLDSTSFIFGLYDWKKYDNLDIHNLMFLDVKFPDPYFYCNIGYYDTSFDNLFQKKYNTSKERYTDVGYNIIMHFCSNFSLFKFQNINEGGKINSNCPLHHYVNYELVPL